LRRPNVVQADGYRSPMPAECGALIDRLKVASYVEVKPAIDTFIQAHDRFARATGVSQHLVAAVHQLGTALASTRNPAACIRAEELARHALHWRPFDAFLWTLWAEALEARGAVAASEILRREQVRRLPFNVDARSQLAEVLIAQDRCEEARVVVDQCFADGLENAFSHALRIRLVGHLDGIGAAKVAAQVAVQEFPDDHILDDFQDLLSGDKVPRLVAARYLKDPLPLTSGASDVLSGFESGTVARLRDLANAREIGARLSMDADAAAVAEVTALLAEEPDFAYAQLLAVRAGILAGEAAELASLPAAFEQALRAEDRQSLARLAERAPKLEALILVAQTLFGDVDAQVRIAQWLSDPVSDESDPIAAMRSRLKVILGGLTDADAVAAGFSARRGNVMAVLQRVTEALIGSDLIAA
jgi:hypothetical protein